MLPMASNMADFAFQVRTPQTAFIFHYPTLRRPRGVKDLMLLLLRESEREDQTTFTTD